MGDHYKVVYDLSNGAIFNDPEWLNLEFKVTGLLLMPSRRIVCAADARSVCDS